MNLDIERKLSKALKQFSVNTLFNDVCPYFQDWITQEELSSEIRRLKHNIDTPSVVGVLINLLKENDITNAEVEDLLSTFLLLGTAYNSSRRTWTSYKLEGDCLQVKFEDEIKEDLKHILEENQLNATIAIKTVDCMQWIQVTERRLVKKRWKDYAPYYVACFIGEPYMFLSKRDVSDDFLKSLSEGFGYTGYKYSNLNGHDLESMFSHLRQKGAKRGIVRPISTLSNIKVTSSGKDFSQHENRRKFVSDIMGTSPPKISNYVVVAKNLPWKGRVQHPSLKTKTFDMKIEFQTEDTAEMLLDMAEHGCLKVPPPSYVVNLMSTGRNNIKLRVQNGNGATDTETQTDAG
ncbi:uncharacterized protein LOC117650489 [Thrips palmi]|uniref:Uncharacterized protein LOC117650489 n=1 Tax=Thrips palmi TaxID=161013 RepID=A0A6P8ZYF4_THRPL|nr:uncharacterized protein LOC117650489 [Thrips palmi]